MLERGVPPEKQIFGWKCYFGEEFPMEDMTETGLFLSFYEKGFALPAGAFFRRLLHFYGLEVTYSPTPSLKLGSSFTSARGIWGSPPTSTYGGLCTASSCTRPTFNGTWWLGPC